MSCLPSTLIFPELEALKSWLNSDENEIGALLYFIYCFVVF